MRCVLRPLQACASEGDTEDDTPRRRTAYSSQVMTINSGARGAFFPRGCLLLVAFSSLALHCGPDFSASCTLTYRKALFPRSHLFCDRVVLANEEEASIDG
ncbi:BZ3500_MvSof-1268-A1-R1_Chr4-2g07022 [Microbotryum saponariae]|uniref:BZ3500_MvSof-1268-A1-R1_Chr4-2g07022 protein n=1 Tax=Microbotryum saponariae TaxID=289078 RepID=A0A2X0NLV8_9BASI|nr:BZ3500_MvSof-1268-A1-R1_Chr4-2g07022 [Microbotryum saponariae]SDA06687.1 BZ3501_MvSof-1269-A2-R1_Chr4-2g06733 [Microbotryum saponariae]